jgi:hypothetical protein
MISLLVGKTDVQLISTDVAGRIRAIPEPGRTIVSHDLFQRNVSSGKYSQTYEFDGSRYGVALPEDLNKVSIWDYPGDYPDCIELNGRVWRGILCLPPDIDTLRSRLVRSTRTERIPSAIEEYTYCLSLVDGKRLSPCWRVLISSEGEMNEDMHSFIKLLQSF